MPLYTPNPVIIHDEVEMCRLAVEHGRQLVLNDLRTCPTQNAKTYVYAAASYVHATLMSNAAKHLLAAMVTNPITAELSNITPAQFAEHKRNLDEQRDHLGHDRAVWACYMQDIAVGIAEAADELFQADGCSHEDHGSSACGLVFQFVFEMPEHRLFRTTPVKRPVSSPSTQPAQAGEAEHQGLSEALRFGDFASLPDQSAAPTVRQDAQSRAVATRVAIGSPVADPEQIAPAAAGAHIPYTTATLIDQWLAAKGNLSRAERSRQGSSVRLFIEAVGLADAPADQLAGIGEDAAARFIEHAVSFPLAPRGERLRITHIKNFIAFAQSLHIAVPDQAWIDVQK